MNLKPRLNLPLSILQGPIRKTLSGDCSPGLFSGEAFCLSGGVISESVEFAELLVRDRRGFLTIGAFVDCDDRGTTEPEVMLEAVFGVLDLAVVGPASKVPG